MAENKKLDLNLYSRQVYVLGLEAMHKIGNAHMLISGMKGLGVEIAKNVILAGPKAVTIHDTEAASLADLSSQFYLTEASVGKNRAEASLGKLSELNPYVQVKAHTGELTEDFLKEFQVVVLTNNKSLESLKKITDFCHANSIAVVVADTRGVFGQIFVDLGAEFVVTDVDGEEYQPQIITSISKGKPGVVTVHDEARINFETDDIVSFEDIQGMEELNGKQFPVKVTGPYSFTIEDTSGFSEYVSKGLVKKAKVGSSSSSFFIFAIAKVICTDSSL